MAVFEFTPRDQFINRVDDLDRLARWWEDRTRDALCMYGRRRVGKSWLFRRFADGKEALLLVANEIAPGPQFKRFAEQIQDTLGVAPVIDDAADLIRVLYRLGRNQKLLAVVDELPWLLPKGAAKREILTAIASVMEEERDDSQTKLVLCGSIIAQMESLLATSSPLHGRLQPLDVHPLTFSEAREMLHPNDSAAETVTRYSVAGGMARYLVEIGTGGSLRSLVCSRVLDRRAPLFNDPRLVLERELREPATYFSLLQELSHGEVGMEHLSNVLRTDSPALTSYMRTLVEMRLISRHQPMGAEDKSRKHKYRLHDGFIRFWFRFVFPYQEDLQSGLDPADLWDGEIRGALSEHTAQAFEDLCRVYTRRHHGSEAQRVGGWWGDSAPGRPDRTQEEIDIVGLKGKRVRILGECKWTSSEMPLSILTDLRDHKLPAILRSKGLKGSSNEGPRVLLFARSGFSKSLTAAAEGDPRIELIDVQQLVSGLTAP
jgi:AAA+ ATPase superfamily predicted ATPase